MRPPSPRWERAARLFVGVAVVAFGVGQSWIAAMSWRSLRPTWGLDLVYFHSQVWNAARGAGFAQSVHWHESQSLFGNSHFNPIILLGVPSQWLAPGLDSLLAMQCFLVGLGGVGIYRIARSHGAGPRLGAGLVLLFLMQAPLWRVTQSDIRPLVWAIPFLLLLVAALAEERRREALVWGLLACLCREEVPVIVAAIALGHAFGMSPPWRRRWRLASGVGAGALTFLVVSSLIRPSSGTYIEPGMWLMEAFGWPLELPRGVGPDPIFVQRFGERIFWLLQWSLPAGLLAFGAPRVLIGALPLFGYLLTTDVGWADWSGEGPHYTAPAVALVGAAVTVSLARIARQQPTGPAPFSGLATGRGEPRSGLAWALLLAALCTQTAQAWGSWEGWIDEDIRGVRNSDPDLIALRELAREVPPDAPVMTDFTTLHLFAGRTALYCYERDAMKPEVHADASGPLLPGRALQPEWALLLDEHVDWIGRAERHGLVVFGRHDGFVLMGPRR